jgi:hypothetical protein
LTVRVASTKEADISAYHYGGHDSHILSQIISRFEFSGWLLDGVLSFENPPSIDEIAEDFAIILPLGSIFNGW